MDSSANSFSPLLGSEHVGMQVYTRAALPLRHRRLSFTDGSDEASRFGITIPANQPGRIEEIEAGSIKLHFSFDIKFADNNPQQTTFFVKKRDFETLFRK